MQILIHWSASGDGRSVQLFFASEARPRLVAIRSCYVRVVSAHAPSCEELDTLVDAFKNGCSNGIKGRGSFPGSLDIDVMRHTGRPSVMPIANRGLIPRLLPPSLAALHVTTLRLSPHTPPPSIPPASAMSLISNATLLAKTQGVFAYCDLEPRTLADLLEWNLTFALRLDRVRLPAMWEGPSTTDKWTEFPTVEDLGATIHNYVTRFKERFEHELNMPYHLITWDIAQPSSAPSSSHAPLGVQQQQQQKQVDILFHLTPPRQASQAVKSRATLHIDLERMMRDFENDRWSVDEFGLPSTKQIDNFILLAVAVAHYTSCPFAQVLDHGRLHTATAFFDKCFDQMNLVPYATVFLIKEKLSQFTSSKRTRDEVSEGSSKEGEGGGVQESTSSSSSSSYKGGRIFDACTGIFFDRADKGSIVLVDFDSHYPSIIVDEGLFYELRSRPQEWARLSDANLFGRTTNELISLKRSKGFYDFSDSIVMGIKFVINAGYGVWGMSNSPVGCVPLASRVTELGRDALEAYHTEIMNLLHPTAATAGAEDGGVLMGHTDSMLVFMSTPEKTKALDALLSEARSRNEKAGRVAKLRVSKLYRCSWVINKVHHISVPQGRYRVDVLATLYQDALCLVERFQQPLAVDLKPAHLVDAFVNEQLQTIINAPGLVSSATPPMIRLLTVVLAATLVYGWIDDWSEDERLQSEDTNFEHLLRSFTRKENTAIAAWCHYFDREAVAKKKLPGEGGNITKNDGNYRSYLADLWANKKSRHVPVVRSAGSQSFDLPNPDDPKATLVDTAWWFRRTIATFEGYVRRLSAEKYGAQIERANKILACVKTYLDVNDSSTATDLAAGSLSNVYRTCLETFDQFCDTHEALLARLPAVEQWIEWAYDTRAQAEPLTSSPDEVASEADIRVVVDELFDDLRTAFGTPAKHELLDIVAEQLVLRFNLSDRLTITNAGQTWRTVTTAAQRLKQTGAYKLIDTTYKVLLSALSKWCIASTPIHLPIDDYDADEAADAEEEARRVDAAEVDI